jgi:hypothetical protein
MAVARSSANDERFSRNQKIKLWSAVVVLALCGVWLVFFLASNRPVSEIVATTPVHRFHQAVVPVFENERFERVILVDSEDGKSITVTGVVTTQQELADLKKGIDDAAAKVAAQGEPIEVKWEVKPAR